MQQLTFDEVKNSRKSYQNDAVRKLDELILRRWQLSSIRVIFNYTK